MSNRHRGRRTTWRATGNTLLVLGLAVGVLPIIVGAALAQTGTGLEIRKSASPVRVDELSAITFTLVVRNGGDAIAHDVGANDNLWDRLTNVTGTFNGPGSDDGNCLLNPANNHVKCEVRELAPGETVTVTIHATTPDLPLRDGGSCEVSFDNDSWVVSNETGYQAPVFSNTVRITVTGTGCNQPSPSPSPSASPTTVSPTPSPTTVSPTPSVSPTTVSPTPSVSPTTVSPTPSPTVSPTTVTPTSTPSVTPPMGTTIHPTTPPGGTAFTGTPNTLPLSALALALLTAGTGLMWIGRRRGRKDGVDES